ncbi:hypothetical protein DN31_3817 [Vibrio mimicus]|nr:hypothetical protein DN31_3817 [Vibrio mimicus]
MSDDEDKQEKKSFRDKLKVALRFVFKRRAILILLLKILFDDE